MLAEGRTIEEIATTLGRNFDSIRGKIRHSKITGQCQAKIDPAEKQAFEQSSQTARVAELERTVSELREALNRKAEKPQHDRLPIESNAEAPVDPAEAWAHAEEDSAKRIQYAYERSRFSIDFNQTDQGKPVAIAFVSDQHISPGNTVDFKRMREDAELIAATPGLYACLGGDGVDNHIKIRSAGLAARSQPHEQYDLFNWYLGIFAHKIMVLISGNHDAWTDQIAGIDMVQNLARQQRLCYCPAEAHISAIVGEVPYAISFRHQYRMNSSFNNGHAVKQWYRLGEELFDIGCVCHQHEPHVESFEAHGLTRWVCRPGSYQITSSYSRQHGWNRTKPTCPTFIIYPKEREIAGFQDIRLAARVLATERN